MNRWPAAVGVVVVAVAWLVAVPGPAQACSCADLALAEYADEMDRAFVGRLVDRTEHSLTADNGVRLAFDVEHAYKGPVERGVEVFTHAQSSACGLDVSGRVGIVASLWRGKLHANSCSSPVAPAELEAVFGAGIALPADRGSSAIPIVLAAVVALAAAAAVVAVVRRRAR